MGIKKSDRPACRLDPVKAVALQCGNEKTEEFETAGFQYLEAKLKTYTTFLYHISLHYDLSHTGFDQEDRLQKRRLITSRVGGGGGKS